MKTALIISGGDFSALTEKIEYDYVIACDKGAAYAAKMNVRPDVIIGDFDSYDGDVRNLFSDVPVEKHPIEKDDTDTMLAIKHALKKGYTHIIITCALGGRLDHTIANLQSMAYTAAHGGICEILSDKENLRTFTGGTIQIPKREGYSLSLFSLSDTCEGLSVSGAKYNVTDVILSNTFPLGLGNHWIDDNITVSMTSGILLISMSSML